MQRGFVRYQQFLILMLLLITSAAYAGHPENITACELRDALYVLDKNKGKWGCHNAAYKIGDTSENETNKKTCESNGYIYGWDSSRYHCVHAQTVNSTSTIPSIQPTYSKPKPEKSDTQLQRDICEKDGNAFIWNADYNVWACRSLAYRINDRRVSAINQSACESYGNQYLWDGQHYHCIGKGSITPPQAENKPNETLIRREKCEKSNYKFEWNGTINEWECVNPSILTKQNNLNKILEASSKPAVLIPIDTSAQTKVPYNDAQEKRAICEQRGFIYAWNGNINEWQCFTQMQKFTDANRNEANEFQCSTQGNHYLEVNRQWQCLKLISTPETKKIDNASLEKICRRYNGSLQWIGNRWVCSTTSTKDEIETAQIPSFKSSTPLSQQKPTLFIDNQKTEYILYFGLTNDGKYFTTYSAAPQKYITRAYNLSNMEQTYSISRDTTDRSTLHKGLLFLYGNYNSPFEVIDLIRQKSLFLLQGTQVHELAMTNDDSLLLLVDNKRNIIAVDTKTWEKRYTIPTTRVNLNYKTILDISKPFFYENIDGQQAALDIKTGKAIIPLPELPPRYGYEIKTAAPATLPPELNTTKGELFFSTDFHYAIETDKGFFHIWDLTKKVKLYTHEGRIENSFSRIQTTNTHAIFRSSQSTCLLDFRNPSLLKQLTYSTEKASNYSQPKSTSILETGGRISWDLDNATAVQQKDRISQTDSIEKKSLDLFRQNIKSLRRIGSIRQIKLSPDKSKIIAVDSGNQIMVWDINKSTLDYTIQNQTQFILTPDSDYIITLSYTPTSEDGPPPEHDLNIWNFKTGTLERTLPKRAMTFTLIPNSNHLALGEHDGTISIWDYRNGLERYRLVGHDTSIYKLEVLPNNYQLLSQDRRGTTILWDNINNIPIGKKQWHRIYHKTLISPDSNYMLLIDSQYKKQESVIRLLNLKTSQYEYELPGSYGTTWGFSPDSKRLYLATPEGATKVYETTTGKELAILHAYDNGEWIILTPQGYFNASPKGRELILDSSGKPIDNATYDTYFKPDKVKEILNQKETR